MSTVRTSHGRWLWALLGAFLARVLAQPLSLIVDWPALPPFDAWQSGALPYRWLLLSQIAIAGWMARAAWRVASGTVRPSPPRGRRVGAAAAVYGLIMSARLVLGLTVQRGHWWFDAPLPTLFHLVLATYLGVYAHYHLLRAPVARGVS